MKQIFIILLIALILVFLMNCFTDRTDTGELTFSINWPNTAEVTGLVSSGVLLLVIAGISPFLTKYFNKNNKN